MAEHILITGEPKVGKTTLLKKILELSRFQTHGFLTEEERIDGKRVAFTIVSSNGISLPLATISDQTAITVGKFFVQVENIDTVASSLVEIPEDHLLFIDEIGQMELHSLPFQKLVSLFLESKQPLVGIISQDFEHQVLDQIRNRTDVRIITVTEENRDTIIHEILDNLD